MKVILNGLKYKAKEIDINNNKIKLENGLEIELKDCEDIHLSFDDFKQIKDFKQPIKKRTKKESVDEVVEEEE